MSVSVKTKKFLFLVALLYSSVTAFAETWAEQKIPDGGYARVAYMSNEGALYVSIQTEFKTEYVVDVAVSCTHRWKANDTWNEELYIICNHIFKNIPVNKIVKLTENVNIPPKNTRTDYYTDYNVTINNLMCASANSYRMVFYAWGSGTYLGEKYERSSTGHAFAYIPGIGYRGFSTKEGEDGHIGVKGDISDHEELFQYATDSFVVYLSKAQWESVKDKYRQLEQNVPRYTIMDYDCTSFTMDLADAAGIRYGNRKFIQWPISFIQELKKHNPSK